MKVEQCIITVVSYGVHQITARIWLACELVEAPDGKFLTVRLLEASPRLPVGAEITVHHTKVDLEA